MRELLYTLILQVTALMGTHSLGRAQLQNSGYSGAWTPKRELMFDNEFYQILRDHASDFENVVRFVINSNNWLNSFFIHEIIIIR